MIIITIIIITIISFHHLEVWKILKVWNTLKNSTTLERHYNFNKVIDIDFYRLSPCIETYIW